MDRWYFGLGPFIRLNVGSQEYSAIGPQSPCRSCQCKLIIVCMWSMSIPCISRGLSKSLLHVSYHVMEPDNSTGTGLMKMMQDNSIGLCFDELVCICRFIWNYEVYTILRDTDRVDSWNLLEPGWKCPPLEGRTLRWEGESLKEMYSASLFTQKAVRPGAHREGWWRRQIR